MIEQLALATALMRGPVPLPPVELGVACALNADNTLTCFKDGIRVEEDSPWWDCHTMGNRVCGVRWSITLDARALALRALTVI
jgi:hypothetical protein